VSELVQEVEPPKKKRKRRSGPSPTALTLEECRNRGWTAEVVEQRIPKTFITRDFIGVIDIIAFSPSDGIIGIQATSGSGGNHAARVHKALAEPRLIKWLRAGGKFQVWSWKKCVGGWELRDEEAVIQPKEGT
jgi:hypothetical protein